GERGQAEPAGATAPEQAGPAAAGDTDLRGRPRPGMSPGGAAAGAAAGGSGLWQPRGAKDEPGSKAGPGKAAAGAATAGAAAAGAAGAGLWRRFGEDDEAGSGPGGPAGT